MLIMEYLVTTEERFYKRFYIENVSRIKILLNVCILSLFIEVYIH